MVASGARFVDNRPTATRGAFLEWEKEVLRKSFTFPITPIVAVHAMPRNLQRVDTHLGHLNVMQWIQFAVLFVELNLASCGVMYAWFRHHVDCARP